MAGGREGVGRVEGRGRVGSQWQVKPSVSTVWTSYGSHAEMPAIGPNMHRWPKKCLPITGVNFRAMSST